MGLPEPFVLSMAIRNNYGIIGHLSLLQQFIGLLYDGEYIRHRDVPYYASRLCVTPHYRSTTANTSGTGTSPTTPPAFASRPTTSPRYARRRAANRRLTG